MKLRLIHVIPAMSFLPLMACAQSTSPTPSSLYDNGALIQELARYQLDALIDHYLATHPDGDEPAVVAMRSTRALLTFSATMEASELFGHIRQVVEHADAILPSLRDPHALMQLAATLITHGLEPDANAVEYWGDDPSAQKRLVPLADLVNRLLERCRLLAQQEANTLAGQFGDNPSTELQKRYLAMDHLASAARYTQHMADYYRVLALAPSDAQRIAIARQAISNLRQYDSPDSQVQPVVRLRIARLHLLVGNHDVALATLASVADAKLTPPATLPQQFEAKFFEVVGRLKTGDISAAEADLKHLHQWSGAHLSDDRELEQRAQASLAMLEYRLERAKGRTPHERQAALDRANAILIGLVQDQPALRPATFQRLAASVPASAALETLDALMLRAIAHEALRGPMSAMPLERGEQACRQLIGRRQIDVETRDEAQWLLAQLLEKQHRHAEAARAYITYVEGSSDRVNRPRAIDGALAAIGRLLDADTNSAEAGELLDRALPLAVEQFGRTDLVYDLARRLHRRGKLDQAISLYEKIPPNDHRLVQGRYFELEARAERFHERSSPPTPEELADFFKLADSIRRMADDSTAMISLDEKDHLALISARTRLMMAEATRNRAPRQTLEILNGFESAVAGLESKERLVAEAMVLRVQAHISLDQPLQATELALRLLTTQGADRGTGFVPVLLKKLEEKLAAARENGDEGDTRRLLESQAALSDSLARWAEHHSDLQVQTHAYQYRVYEAAVRHKAAQTLPVPSEREQALRQTLALYDRLLSAEGISRWRRTIDPQKSDPAYGDVTVLLGKARVLYDLGEYEEAAKRFARLLEDRKLGGPTIAETQGDNPIYWEATYKLYRANYERDRRSSTADAKKRLEETRMGLKRLYIRQGKNVGGRLWKEQFEQLRQQLLNDGHTKL